jgi:hypothetical protein
MPEGLQITGQFIVAEVRKNKSDTVRVTRALVNGSPYVFIQLFSTWGDGKPTTPKPIGKPISLRVELTTELIEALTAARDWLL